MIEIKQYVDEIITLYPSCQESLLSTMDEVDGWYRRDFGEFEVLCRVDAVYLNIKSEGDTVAIEFKNGTLDTVTNPIELPEEEAKYLREFISFMKSTKRLYDTGRRNKSKIKSYAINDGENDRQDLIDYLEDDKAKFIF